VEIVKKKIYTLLTAARPGIASEVRLCVAVSPVQPSAAL